MSQSSLPLWGQAWKLTVRYAAGGGTSTLQVLTANNWEPEALRMTFDVLQSTLPSPWWFADVSVYNLDDPSTQNALLNATWATLEAGFQSGPNQSAIIWDGPVLQVLFDRENVVDFRITFHCVANPLMFDDIVAFSQGPFASQTQLVARMASEANLTMSYGDKAQTAMSAKQYPRGNTVFGKVSRYMRQIADDNFMQHWKDGNAGYISELTSSSNRADLVYSPPMPPNFQSSGLTSSTSQTILGVPRQTPFGCIFTVLLDPRLKVQLPALTVQLTRTLISQLRVIPGQTVATPQDANLRFLVAQVRHTGDTRGNDWQTEVTGYSTVYAQNLIDGIFQATGGGAQ